MALNKMKPTDAATVFPCKYHHRWVRYTGHGWGKVGVGRLPLASDVCLHYGRLSSEVKINL